MSHDCDERPASPPPDPSNQQEQHAANTDHEQDITEPEPTVSITPVTLPTEQKATTSNSPSTGIATETTSPQQLPTNTTPQDMDLDNMHKGQK